MSIELTKEIKLTISMIEQGVDVPEAMKNKAIEQMEVMLMSCEESDAEYVLGRMVLDGIKQCNRDTFKQIAKLVGAMYPDERDADVYNQEEFNKLEKLGKQAIDSFTDKGKDKLKTAVIKKFVEVGLIPVYHTERFMLLLNHVDGYIMVASINGSHDKRELTMMLADLPADIKINVIGLVQQCMGIPDIEFKFIDIAMDKYVDGKVMLKVEELH